MKCSFRRSGPFAVDPCKANKPLQRRLYEQPHLSWESPSPSLSSATKKAALSDQTNRFVLFPEIRTVRRRQGQQHFRRLLVEQQPHQQPRLSLESWISPPPNLWRFDFLPIKRDQKARAFRPNQHVRIISRDPDRSSSTSTRPTTSSVTTSWTATSSAASPLSRELNFLPINHDQKARALRQNLKVRIISGVPDYSSPTSTRPTTSSATTSWTATSSTALPLFRE